MKNRQKNFFSATRSNELPELERFKKMTFLTLEPNQDSKSQKKMEVTQTHTKENYLQSNCGYYMNRFQEVCQTITKEKFSKVNKDIDNLLKTLRNEKAYETFFHALVLNTDQNEDIFFEELEEYFKNMQGYKIEKLFDYSFNEIKNLFKNLYNDNYEENKEFYANEDLCSAQKVNYIFNIYIYIYIYMY